MKQSNAIYIATYRGELWQVPPDTSGSPILLDKWGPYDEDDFTPWIGSDGTNLFWIAGQNPEVRISDDDEGVLLKTVLSVNNSAVSRRSCLLPDTGLQLPGSTVSAETRAQQLPAVFPRPPRREWP